MFGEVIGYPHLTVKPPFSSKVTRAPLKGARPAAISAFIMVSRRSERAVRHNATLAQRSQENRSALSAVGLAGVVIGAGVALVACRAALAGQYQPSTSLSPVKPGLSVVARNRATAVATAILP